MLESCNSSVDGVENVSFVGLQWHRVVRGLLLTNTSNVQY